MSLSKSCLLNLPEQREPFENGFHVTLSSYMSFLFPLHTAPSLSPLFDMFHPSQCYRRRRTQPLQHQRSPVGDDHCWAARRVQTPHLHLLRLRQRSRDKRLASACWLLKKLPLFGKTPLRRAQTALKSMSLRPRLASERDDGREGCGVGSKEW